MRFSRGAPDSVSDEVGVIGFNDASHDAAAPSALREIPTYDGHPIMGCIFDLVKDPSLVADTAEAATEEPPPEAPSSEQPAQEPPPSFTPPPASLEMLVMSLAMQAEMELAGGDPSQPPNLALAQHSIDLLGVIKEKTKGNLELSEQRLLENSLTELRFRYVQKVQEINQQSKGGAESGD